MHTYEVTLDGASEPYVVKDVTKVEQTENTYSFYRDELLLFSAPFASVATVEIK